MTIGERVEPRRRPGDESKRPAIARRRRPARPIAGVLALVGLAACAWRPARFADAPVVTEVADDAPIGMPRAVRAPDEFLVADAFLRRVVIGALDPRRDGPAGDVNALDEVPASSWLSPDAPPAGFEERGPPMPPLSVVDREAVAVRRGVAVVDARGVAWELGGDDPDRPEMRTGAAPVATRLLRGFGYRVPEAHVVRLEEGSLLASGGAVARRAAFLGEGPPPRAGSHRVVAVRWPVGRDVGPTLPTGRRGDDPNDRVRHEDRRTLRALRVFGAFLGIHRLVPQGLRDTYVGAPGQGHLVHAVTGLDGALGADDVVRAEAPELADALDESAGRRALTLGLAPDLEPTPTQRRRPALGAFDATVIVADYMPAPPLLPIDRCTPADAYWAAKQVAALSRGALEAAVATARLSDPESARMLLERLVGRRDAVVAEVFAQVTPLDVADAGGATVELVDRAAVGPVGAARATGYTVEVHDGGGEALAPLSRLAASGSRVRVSIPDAVAAHPYLVVVIRAERARGAAPRPVEVHLGPGGRLLGVRH